MKKIFLYLSINSSYLLLTCLIISVVFIKAFFEWPLAGTKSGYTTRVLMIGIIVLALFLTFLFLGVLLNGFIEGGNVNTAFFIMTGLGSCLLIDIFNGIPSKLLLVFGTVCLFFFSFNLIKKVLPILNRALFDFPKVERDNKYFIVISIITFFIGLFFGK